MVSDKFARLRAKLASVESSDVGKFDPLTKTYTTALSTKKDPSIHALNRKVEAKLTETRSASDIVAGLQRKEFVAEEWIPDAYVLFTRRWKCQCGVAGTCLDRPELFLRHRHIRRPKNLNALKDPNDPGLRYLPVKILALASLPRLREVSFRSLVVCESCFDKKEALTSWQQKQSSSPQADIVTVPAEPAQPDSRPRSEIRDLLESAFLRKRSWNTEELEAGWLQLQSTGSTCEPSDFASLNSATSAPAQDTTSPTREDHQSACS
jgi:hypothetical protein